MTSRLLQLLFCWLLACGVDQSGSSPLTSDGTPVKEGEFPWHVGIYKIRDGVYEHICGGSLISLKYVLSAAQCCWDNANNEKYPEDLYKVIAGKFHRSYTNIDPGQEERAVTNIDIHPLFGGSLTNYHDDIAVLTVNKPFRHEENIHPVAVDWDDIYKTGPGDMGHVAGWGLTVKGEISEELGSAVYSVISYGQCRKEIKPKYQQYLGSDKICTGYKNGATICGGYGGEGLTFVHQINSTGLSNKAFFVQGIVSASLGPNPVGTCNQEYYVLFTKLSRFRDFLEKYRQ